MWTASLQHPVHLVLHLLQAQANDSLTQLEHQQSFPKEKEGRKIYLDKLREFWFLIQLLWLFYEGSQWDLLLQGNPNMDLHLGDPLAISRQPLMNTEPDQRRERRQRGRPTSEKIMCCELTWRRSMAAKASCSSICLLLSRARESYILVLPEEKRCCLG